jgi:hypothetical protein
MSILTVISDNPNPTPNASHQQEKKKISSPQAEERGNGEAKKRIFHLIRLIA